MRFLPTAPDVDGRRVALLPQQQLRGPVPQGDHLVGVRSAETNPTHTLSPDGSEETLESGSPDTGSSSRVLEDRVVIRSPWRRVSLLGSSNPPTQGHVNMLLTSPAKFMIFTKLVQGHLM